jgi:uncharacterized protein (DUF1778 family)
MTKIARKHRENSKLEQVNIRLTTEQKKLLDNNAKSHNLNRTDYILFLVANDSIKK